MHKFTAPNGLAKEDYSDHSQTPLVSAVSHHFIVPLALPNLTANSSHFFPKQQFYTVMEPSNNLCLRLHVHDREVGFNVYHEGFFTPLVLDMNKFIAPNGVSKEDDSYLSHTPLVLSTPQCASRTKDPSVVQE